MKFVTIPHVIFYVHFMMKNALKNKIKQNENAPKNQKHNTPAHIYFRSMPTSVFLCVMLLQKKKKNAYAKYSL